MRSAAVFMVISTLLFTGAPALAADVDAQSRAYFETGAKAYEKGDYLNAIRAFEQAYALTKRPGLIFSIGQSYKRQYTVDAKPQNLRKALEHYRRFLAEDKTGKRRGDASSAIMEIEAILARFPAEQEAAATTPDPPQPTQISVTTQVEDAMISIDGGKPRTLEPVEVTPGKHKVVIQAPGYFPEERELYAGEKQMTAIDVPLRPMPAKVSIEGREGSTVTVDGLPMGSLPLVTPLEIDAGERTISVSQSGFVTYTKDYAVSRGQSLKVKADLSRTRQRIGSFILFGTGVLIAGGGVLMAMGSGAAYAQGTEIDQRRKAGSITAEELATYSTLRTQQSDLLVGSTVAFNVAGATAALGFLLYYFDDPKLTPPKAKKDEKVPTREPSPGLRDMMLVPAASPGFAGLSFGARF
ncbi:MAG: PEGA domain-containing protein [Polyangiaceae bacterium]|nr:PEGA domain-containing protein [Polyangiaceae bacterium]